MYSYVDMSKNKNDDYRRLQLCLRPEAAFKLEEIARITKLKYVTIIVNGIEKEYAKVVEGVK